MIPSDAPPAEPSDVPPTKPSDALTHTQPKKVKLKRLEKISPKAQTETISEVATKTTDEASMDDMYYTNIGNIVKDIRIFVVKKNPKTTKKVKYEVTKRSSNRLKTLKTKTIKGPGARNDELMMLHEDEKRTLTQEPIVVETYPRLGTCIRAMRYWNEISKRLTQ
ncbi:hypothetical protein RYX36_017219 [Vicia faba]